MGGSSQDCLWVLPGLSAGPSRTVHGSFQADLLLKPAFQTHCAVLLILVETILEEVTE